MHRIQRKKGLSCSRKRHHGSDDEWTYNGGYSGYVGSRYWGDDGANDHCDYRQEDRSYRSDRRDDKQEGKRGKPSDSQRGEYRGLRRQNIPRRQDQDSEEGAAKKKAETEANEAELWKKKEDPVMTRTGGAYIPPAKLRMMQSQITDKSSVAFQRLTWEALKKSIHGLINKVNTSNIGNVVFSLIKENIIRGRGLFARSIIQAQAASPTFTHIYAALTAVINSKFPDIGELVLTRLILRFRRSFCRNDISVCISSTRFIAHLVNQQVACEVLALEILTLLLENATGHSVEVAVGFLKECGQKLGQVSPRGLTAVFDRLRHILHEVDLDKRVKYMIEVMFQVRKDGFKDYPAVMEELDLVEEKDQITHLVSTAEENLNGEDILNVFNPDPDYEAKEERYSAIKKEILGVKCGQSGESAVESDDEFEGESDSDEEEVHKGAIADETETNSTAFRRAIYLTIQSSLDHNECAHKVMKMRMKPGQKTELCHMILDCCAQEKMYNISFGLLAERFCRINKSYIASFEQIFRNSYDTIHRLDNNQLRNVASMFAHLLFTDAISWQVLEHLRLTEEGTTSSSRIFLKILFQKLAENMGLGKLNQRLKDPTLESAFEGIFPRDHPCNTRFAINFFTSVGLGVLTDELRVHLRTHPKPPPVGVPRPVSALSAAAAQLLIEQSSDSGSSSSS